MSTALPARNPNNRRRCGAILARLVDDLLDYTGRFLKRHGMVSATIAVRLHEGRVVLVTHYVSARISLPSSVETRASVR